MNVLQFRPVSNKVRKGEETGGKNTPERTRRKQDNPNKNEQQNEVLQTERYCFSKHTSGA